MNAATPGQAAAHAFVIGCVKRGITASQAAVPPEGQLATVRGLWADVAQAGHEAIAAREPHAAPGPAGCECGHAQTGHAFSDDVCAVPDCPCPGYRPAPRPAPELAADSVRLAVIAQLREFTGCTADDDDCRTCDLRAAAIIGAIREAHGSPEQPAPELAAAMDAPAALARVLSWFPVAGTRNEATATRAQLAHAYQDGSLTVPEELRRFL